MNKAGISRKFRISCFILYTESLKYWFCNPNQDLLKGTPLKSGSSFISPMPYQEESQGHFTICGNNGMWAMCTAKWNRTTKVLRTLCCVLPRHTCCAFMSWTGLDSLDGLTPMKITLIEEKASKEMKTKFIEEVIGKFVESLLCGVTLRKPGESSKKREIVLLTNRQLKLVLLWLWVHT